MPARFRPGRVIRTVPGAVRMIVDGRHLYFMRRLYHPRFLASWPVFLIASSVRAGRIRAAVAVPVEPPRPWPEPPRKEADDVPTG